ncbi:MAG: hypothetical protein FJ137_23565, partial [Deltaproteobacteria bacterium]|nr:hypothetical protein [Deltaproteobacteria bacterium]
TTVTTTTKGLRMEESFWVERWTTGQIGFHLPTPHPLLAAHHDAITGARHVYVPLCGKTVDLPWLRARGHDVTGVELVPDAVSQLVAEQGLEPTTTTTGAFTHHHIDADEGAGRGRLDVLVGDALAVSAPLFLSATAGLADAVYDRAALVALHPSQRAAYVASLLRVLRPGGRVLLITFAYDQTRLDGPPWSIDDDVVRELFASAFTAQTLAVRDEPLGPKFVAAGVTALRERCVLLTHRG